MNMNNKTIEILKMFKENATVKELINLIKNNDINIDLMLQNKEEKVDSF